MHNAAFATLGLDAVYVPIRCEPDAVAGLMSALAAAGGGGNVTVPHKRLAAAAVQRWADGPLEACNTFWAEDGSLVGTETDSVGILRAWRSLGSPPGDWLILGTGGSADAAARAAKTAGAAIQVRSRSPERASRFLAVNGTGRVAAGAVGLVINCTPLGLAAGDRLPLDPAEWPAGAAALDLVYADGGTPWVRAVAALGAPAVDGLEVLLGQGAAAFEVWFPGVTAPIDVMNAALRRMA